MKYWLKLAGREGARNKMDSLFPTLHNFSAFPAEKLWRVGKSEEVGFKARNKLITGEVLYKGGKE